MPARPKLATAEAGQVQYTTWDGYVSEVMANVEPFVQPVPPTEDDPNPAPVEVSCPTGAQMDALNAARASGNDELGLQALYGEELGHRLFVATRGTGFIVRAKLLSDVMMHYSMQAANGMPGRPNPE